MSARDSAACNRDWRECVDPRCGEGVCIQSGAREFDQSAADKRNKVKVADAACNRDWRVALTPDEAHTFVKHYLHTASLLDATESALRERNARLDRIERMAKGEVDV